MRTLETGFCSDCGTFHAVDAPGAFKECGVLCSLAVLVGPKRLELAAALFLGSFFFGNVVERWVRARCPECGAALQRLASVQRARVV